LNLFEIQSVALSSSEGPDKVEVEEVEIVGRSLSNDEPVISMSVPVHNYIVNLSDSGVILTHANDM
jgi:hypothetical protein